MISADRQSLVSTAPKIQLPMAPKPQSEENKQGQTGPFTKSRTGLHPRVFETEEGPTPSLTGARQAQDMSAP